MKAGTPVTGGFSFRLSGKTYQADNTTCLYRAVDAEAMTTRFLLLTRDGRFAYLDRVIGGKGVYAAEEWGGDRAQRFLMQHGESDVVEEFPDIFRRRVAPPAAPKVKKAKDSAAEPFLFPLH